MPYKPTGRPNGRPRKNQPAAIDPAEAPQPPRVNLPRARARYRMLAEMKNPSPFVPILDKRGRARHKPRHSSVKV